MLVEGGDDDEKDELLAALVAVHMLLLMEVVLPKHHWILREGQREEKRSDHYLHQTMKTQEAEMMEGNNCRWHYRWQW